MNKIYKSQPDNKYALFNENNQFIGFGYQQLQSLPKYKLETKEIKYDTIENGKVVKKIKTEQRQTPDGEEIIEIDKLPEGAIVITDILHQEYLHALNSQQKKLIKDNKGKIQIVDKYTAEEILEQELQAKSNERIALANSLLNLHKEKWTNFIIWDSFTKDQKKVITNFYNDLIDFRDGKIEIIPTIEI